MIGMRQKSVLDWSILTVKRPEHRARGHLAELALVAIIALQDTMQQIIALTRWLR
jgi:hypothetical protein